MSDVTQGQDAPTDDTLFRDAVDAATLEKFENPAPVKPAEKTADVKADPKPADQNDGRPEAAIPAFRLREESEARRRAEQDRDDLRRRLEMLERQPPQQQRQAPAKIDIFDNPNGFVRQEVEPLFNEFRAELQRTREAMSLDNALGRYGEEKVNAARLALEQGMGRGDPAAWSTYNRAMQGHDPYGIIARWHQERETLNSIGGDLTTYKQRVLDEAMKDPEFQKRVMEATRGAALASGQTIHRPAQSKVPTTPSLANFGSGGGDEAIQEPSDDQLFRQAVSAKRR